ncbi:MAG: DUF2148 domain-containing protein [Candidatus Bathyarchaeota archaeon]|jgi:uncharacterized ferredoxin-like protein|nr:DUF2148 domain-containing protein [Candidatus Bathyarchaeota archaeon]
MIIQSDPAENQGLLQVAQLMVVAARTAPKARGEDDISTAIVSQDDKGTLADTMEALGRTRDAQNVRDAGIVVLIGVKCGLASDAFWPFKAKLVDLGIAVGSAAKVASDLNVDNRIMYSIGVAAKKLKLLDADEIQGIPLSVSGKNIFFDRKR